MHVLCLPWPHRDLHPNARVHWGKKARVAKKARKAAGEVAWAAGIRRLTADALHVTIIFYPPDRRPRDEDGMLSACKSSLDGIADVVGVDDSKWSIAIKREEPRKGGVVRVEIQPVGVTG